MYSSTDRNGIIAQPQSHVFPPYPAPRTINALAVVSVVLGLAWIYWVGSALAVVVGLVARQRIRRTGQGGDALALAGIALGWLGLATLVLYVLVSAWTVGH